MNTFFKSLKKSKVLGSQEKPHTLETRSFLGDDHVIEFDVP